MMTMRRIRGCRLDHVTRVAQVAVSDDPDQLAILYHGQLIDAMLLDEGASVRDCVLRFHSVDVSLHFLFDMHGTVFPF